MGTATALEVALPGGVVLAFGRVASGAFSMGSADGRDDERPVHVVELGAFFLATTPVTNAQYAPFAESGHAPAPPWWTHADFSAADQPVVGVTWAEAQAYAAWVGDLAGTVARLPTEAEWERAARGGEDGGMYEAPPEVPDGPLAGPWRVAQGRPNAYGLFDLGTIVHEWCADWYAAGYYAQSPRAQPRGPEEGTRRASRGGSWRHKVRWSPPSGRSSLPPESRYADYGFRLLMDVEASHEPTP